MSTILGFVPFMMGDETSFWFLLIAGNIGGLVMLVIGILIYLFVLSTPDIVRKVFKKRKLHQNMLFPNKNIFHAK